MKFSFHVTSWTYSIVRRLPIGVFHQGRKRFCLLFFMQSWIVPKWNRWRKMQAVQHRHIHEWFWKHQCLRVVCGRTVPRPRRKSELQIVPGRQMEQQSSSKEWKWLPRLPNRQVFSDSKYWFWLHLLPGWNPRKERSHGWHKHNCLPSLCCWPLP